MRTRFFLALFLIAAGSYVLIRHLFYQGGPMPDTASSIRFTAPESRNGEAPEPPAAASTPVSDGAPGAGVSEEFCGYGQVTVDPDGGSARYRFLRGVTHDRAQRWLTGLLNSDDIRARAAGLLMERAVGQPDPQPMKEQSQSELVGMAVGANDPAVYAMALAACNVYTTPSDGACRRLSLAGWASLDPDNAVPWLLLAGKANARNDLSASSRYFDRAVQAKFVKSYEDSLLTFADAEIPEDALALERWYLTVQALGASSVMTPPFALMLRHCSDAALEDDHVREQCSAVAELMISGSTTVLEFDAGVHLGARTGWSTMRVSELDAASDAWQQLSMPEARADGAEDFGCAAVERNNAYWRRREQVGELRALRERLEESGLTVSELAQKHKEYVDRIIFKAQRTASESRQDEVTPTAL